MLCLDTVVGFALVLSLAGNKNHLPKSDAGRSSNSMWTLMTNLCYLTLPEIDTFLGTSLYFS